MNPKVDEFINKAKNWQKEFEQLRRIVLDCQVTEEFKWRQPCYTFNGKNIVIIGGFKEYCVLSFFKGALIKDVHNLLESIGEHTQAGRKIEFKNVEEIVKRESQLKSYIFQALEVEKAGLEVQHKKVSEYDIPEELQQEFDKNPDFKIAFKRLTPGRKKGYLLYFSAPKQSKTRVSRIESYTQKILDGKGFHDCTCGMSKRMPNCDGSHKYLERN